MDVAAWINDLQDQTGVSATARNEIVPAPQDLKLGLPLVINGVTITDATSATTVRALANAINASQAESGATFTARVSPNGELMITNAPGHEGEDITISATTALGSSAANALGLSSKTYRGQVTLTQPLLDEKGVSITKPIQLGFGSGGTPADLAKLGFRTGAYISGAAKDDLLVFVTGTGTASISASYSGKPADPKQALRAQQIKVEFLPDTDPTNPQYNYQIIDSASKTVLAQRKLDPAQLVPGINYQGLELSFTAVPKAGDSFTLDGNVDGIGSNDNMLAMNALETKAVVGKKTLSNAYIDHVNEMGNIARQATISQTALTVVHDQAVKSRDEVAGVSLDKEAGDLIRYQQAYQAAAKTLQVASQLFDTMLQIR
jgi:flagellar hook-associated protein FlgK